MKQLGERIQEKRNELGLSQGELARRIGISRAAVSQMESSETKGPRPDNLLAISRVLGVSVEWLVTGKESLGRQGNADQGSRSNVGPGPEIKGRVPLISWIQAGAAEEVVDLYTPGVADDWIETTVQTKEHTYALRVEGESMAPNFPPGTILIVEPDMPAEIGDYVIAKNNEEEATFKKLAKDAGRWYLKPLNQQYPMIELDGYHVIGVVREAVQRFR